MTCRDYSKAAALPVAGRVHRRGWRSQARNTIAPPGDKPLTLESFKGQTLLLEFWMAWGGLHAEANQHLELLTTYKGVPFVCKAKVENVENGQARLRTNAPSLICLLNEASDAQ